MKFFIDTANLAQIKEAVENIKEAITAWLWAEDQKAVANFKTESQSAVLIAV